MLDGGISLYGMFQRSEKAMSSKVHNKEAKQLAVCPCSNKIELLQLFKFTKLLQHGKICW